MLIPAWHTQPYLHCKQGTISTHNIPILCGISHGTGFKIGEHSISYLIYINDLKVYTNMKES
eukprot:330291-Ditylum_brightwellii.AAC.1